MHILDRIALAVAAFGGLIIAWGILRTAIRVIGFEASSFVHGGTCRQRDAIRHQLGSYLLLGLEFMVAADVIATIRDPSLEEIGVLAGIVVIRTVIAHFLDRELADIER